MELNAVRGKKKAKKNKAAARAKAGAKLLDCI